MVIFKSCECGKPLISLEKDVILTRNAIDIIKNNCTMKCPCCKSTIHFKKEEFNIFFAENTTALV